MERLFESLPMHKSDVYVPTDFRSYARMFGQCIPLIDPESTKTRLERRTRWLFLELTRFRGHLRMLRGVRDGQ